MDKTDLVIAQKEEELKFLREELEKALDPRSDTHYEFIPILYRALNMATWELEKIKELAAVQASAAGSVFSSYVAKVLSGENASLTITAHVNTPYSNEWLHIMDINKMRAKNTLLCSINLSERVEEYLPSNADQALIHIGWKRSKKKKSFRLKYSIRNEEDMQNFHMVISRTLLDAFDHLIKAAKEHFYVLNK